MGVLGPSFIGRKKKGKKCIRACNVPWGGKEADFDGMVWKSLSEEETFNQKPSLPKEARKLDRCLWGKALEAEGTAYAKTLRQEKTWPSSFEKQTLKVSLILGKLLQNLLLLGYFIFVISFPEA